MFVICLAPLVLLVFARHGMRVTLGEHDPRFEFDYGGALGTAPGMIATALLAPLAGFKRRVALWWLLFPVGIYYACIIGARVAVLSTPSPRKAVGQSSAGGHRADDLIRVHLSRR